MKKTKKRFQSTFLSLVLCLSLVVGYVQPASAFDITRQESMSEKEESANTVLFTMETASTEENSSEEPDSNLAVPTGLDDDQEENVAAANLELYWDDSKATDKTWEIAAEQKELTISPQIMISTNKDYEANTFNLTIPGQVYSYRDGDGSGASLTNSSDIKASLATYGFDIKQSSNGVDYVIYNTRDVYSGITLNIYPVYSADLIKTVDMKDFTYNIALDTNGNVQTKSIVGRIPTGINGLTVSKNESGTGERKGQVFKWSEALKNKFNVEEADLDTTNYYYMQYEVLPAVSGNQPYSIKLEERPGQNGEVVAVTYYKDDSYINVEESDGTYIPKENGNPIAFEYGDAATRTLYVLVRYPIASVTGASITNEVTVTVAGIDNDANDVKSADATNTHSWKTATTVYSGDIWGIKKWGITENKAGGLSILKNGGDKQFSYYINGIAHTYVYGNFANYSESANGPYTVEVIDDAMYLYGCGDDKLYHLEEGDYYYKKIDVRVQDYAVGDIDESGNPIDLVEKEDMPNVELYVMKAGSDEWEHYESLSPSGWTKWEGDRVMSYGSVAFTEEEGVYRIKVVYPGSNGDTLVRLKLTGDVKADGENVSAAISVAKEKNVQTIQLQNWAAIHGYDVYGTWENPTKEENIHADDTTTKDLLNFDSSFYAGHGEDNYSQRAVVTQPISTANVLVGAAKGNSDYSVDSNGNVSITYQLVATELADTRLQVDAEAMVESGILKGSKKVTFYDLLPAGMEYAGYNKVTKMEIPDEGCTLNYGFTEKDGKPSTNYWYAESIYKVSEIDIPSNVTVELTDNYKGTGRQMVKLTLEYSDTPYGTVGSGYKIYGCVYGIELNAVSTTRDLTCYDSTAVNCFAAQFYDENDVPYSWSDEEHASADDGSYFPEIKGSDGTAAFSGLYDGSGDAYNTVFASDTITVPQYSVVSGIDKAVRADDSTEAFGELATVPLGGDYTYRIRYLLAKGTSKDLVIFDTIEEAYGENPYWKGTLQGVDISEAETAGIPVTVYVNKTHAYTDEEYTTNVEQNRDGLKLSDLTEENGWEKVENPDTYSDWENVKSIAFHCDKEFSDDGTKSVTLYLKMKATSQYPEGQNESTTIYAYNSPAYYSKVVENAGGAEKEATVRGNVVRVQTSIEPVTVQAPIAVKKMEGPVPEGFSYYFIFKITPQEGAPSVTGSGGSVSVNVTSAGEIEASGYNKTGFGSAKFTYPGTYEYLIQEVIPDICAPYISYDASVYKWTVNVSAVAGDDGIDKLVATSTLTKIKDSEGNDITPVTCEKPVFVNKYKTVEITGEKTWEDADNQDGVRPDSITVNLLADGEEVDSVEISADTEWKYSFTNLPEYTLSSAKIVYTIEEVMDSETASYYTVEYDGYNITNTHTPETIEIEGSKTWKDGDDKDGIRPDSITVNLLANGTKLEDKTLTVTAEDDWKYSWTDLPKYENGDEIEYTITEEKVEGYTASIDGYNITNTHTPVEITTTESTTTEETTTGTDISTTEEITTGTDISTTEEITTGTDISTTEGTPTGTDTSANTGDTTDVMLMMILLIIAAAGMVLIQGLKDNE